MSIWYNIGNHRKERISCRDPCGTDKERFQLIYESICRVTLLVFVIQIRIMVWKDILSPFDQSVVFVPQEDTRRTLLKTFWPLLVKEYVFLANRFSSSCDSEKTFILFVHLFASLSSVYCLSYDNNILIILSVIWGEQRVKTRTGRQHTNDFNEGWPSSSWLGSSNDFSRRRQFEKTTTASESESWRKHRKIPAVSQWRALGFISDFGSWCRLSFTASLPTQTRHGEQFLHWVLQVRKTVDKKSCS